MATTDTASLNSTKHIQTTNPLDLLADTLAFGVVFAILLTVIQRGFGFVRGILFCRMMTDQELGQWSMVYSFMMLLAPFAVLGLPGCFGRFVEHYLQRGQLTTFIRRIAVISCVLTFGLAFCMYLAPIHFSKFIFRSEQFVGIVNAMAFALIFVTANNFLSTLMESLRQVRRATLMRFITGVAFAILGTGMIATWKDGSIAATMAFGIACVLGLFPAVTFLLKHKSAITDSGEFLTHSKMWKRIAPFALWLWASNFVTNMFEVSDRYMLVHWSNASVEQAHGFVGQYHSGRVLPLLLVGIGVVVEGALLPYSTALWEKGKSKDAKNMIRLAFKWASIGFTAVGFAILLFAPLIFDQVFQGRYDDGQSVLPATLLYCVWFSLLNLLATYLLVIEKGKWVFAVFGSGLMVNLLLNFMLIPQFGLWGAVSATTISMLLTLVTIMVANHLSGLKLRVGEITVAFSPVVLLLHPILAGILLSVFVGIAIATNFVFDSREKAIAWQHCKALVDRIRPT